MSNGAMTTSGGGWGRAKLFPIAAIVVGLLGGFTLGRAMRSPNPAGDGGTVAATAPRPGDEGKHPRAPFKVEAPGKAAEPARDTEPTKAAEVPTAPRAVEEPKAAVKKIHVESTPSGAAVARDDGESLGTTPFDLDLPTKREITIQFYKPGFDGAFRKITPKSEDLTVKLTPTGPPRPKKNKRKNMDSTTTMDPFN